MPGLKVNHINYRESSQKYGLTERASIICGACHVIIYMSTYMRVVSTNPVSVDKGIFQEN